MIKGHCFTNLDDYEREVWPSYFAAKPELGERVKAKSGKSLKVVGITYKGGYQGESISGPEIIVELNK